MSSGAVEGVEKAGTPLGLPRELFWDVDPAKLDVQMHAKTIISRVVELGRLVDWKRVRGHYGDAEMKRVLMSLRDLSPQGVSLCCAAFGLRKEDFRCCTGKPFPPAPWIY
jgi:hypothetical protein